MGEVKTKALGTVRATSHGTKLSMPKQKAYRFVPELVPIDLWGRSASKMLGTRAVGTEKIRPEALAAASNACEICGIEQDAGLICHDKWLYNDEKCTATLAGFEIHCRDCDSVTHLGRAAMLGDSKEALLGAMVHICRVNGVDPSTAGSIIHSSLDLW